MTKVSICIPLYNHKNFIGRCIDSVLNQTYQNIEIIVSDDNSSDNGVDLVENIKDSRIKIIKNKINLGPSVNINKAVENAVGDYIIVLASDDMLYSDTIDKYLQKTLESPEALLYFGWFQTIDQNDIEIDSYNMVVGNKSRNPELYLWELFSGNNFLMGSGVLYKKNFFEIVGKFDPLLIQTQDMDMWVRTLTAGHKISIVEEKIIKYRIHSDNLSNNLVDPKKMITMQSRYLFEIQKVLEHYLNIKDFELFKKTFPNTLNYNFVDEKYKNFYLMKEAIRVGNLSDSLYHVAYKLFAVNIAHIIFKNKNLTQEISEKFGFNFADFCIELNNIINDKNIIFLKNLIENPFNSLPQNKFSINQFFKFKNKFKF
jgi:glycosyltransferase involved in cell wall biosynthesis